MKTIKSQILTNMLLVLIFFGIAVGGSSAYLSYTSTINTLNHTLTETVQVAADQISATLIGYENHLMEAAKSPTIIDYDTQSVPVGTLLRGIQSRTIFHTVSISDAEGKTNQRTSIAEEEYFIRCKSTEQVAISDMIVDEKTGALSMIIATPVVKNGRFAGVIYGVADGQFLVDMISGIQVGSSGTSQIINKSGTVIANADTQLVVQKQNLIEQAKSDKSLAQIAKMQQKQIARESGFGSFAENGTTRLLAYAPIPNTDGWSVGIMVSRSEFVKDTRNSIIAIIVITAIMSLVGFYSAVKTADVTTKPINLCVDRLVLLSKGDLHSPIPDIKTKNETKILIDAMKTTIDGLNAHISDVAHHLGEIAKGNLTTSVSMQYVGDFASLGTATTEIISSLSTAITQIDQSASSVSSGSEQVSSGAVALSQGATEQASAIEELSATINEVSEQIIRSAESAKSANTLSLQTNQEIQAGNQQMKKMTGAMQEISNASLQISKIIKTIDDIAFQTNILALNATIEAARAGAAGKGFAVVADEVRNLAGKSAQAAKSTTTLIESSIRAVNHGTQIADQTAETLLGIVERTKDVAQMITKIAQTSSEQAVSMNQITQGMDQISAVVQTNSATAEQSAAASAELTTQAQTLKQLVGRFETQTDTELMQPKSFESYFDDLTKY